MNTQQLWLAAQTCLHKVLGQEDRRGSLERRRGCYRNVGTREIHMVNMLKYASCMYEVTKI